MLHVCVSAVSKIDRNQNWNRKSSYCIDVKNDDKIGTDTDHSACPELHFSDEWMNELPWTACSLSS